MKVEKLLRTECYRTRSVATKTESVSPNTTRTRPRSFLSRLVRLRDYSSANNEQNMTSAQESFTEAGEELDTVEIGKQLERVKWFLWHGNVLRALDTMEDIEDQGDLLPQDCESRKKLLKAVREFRGYIEANQNFIPARRRRFQRPSRSPR